jgi:hypothetical protein
MNQTTITTKTKNTKRTKTLKNNRNKNQRQGQKKSVVQKVTRIINTNKRPSRRIRPNLTRKRNYWHNYFVDTQLATESSVHKAIQTLFYPTHGIYRGVSNGMETSAISYIAGSMDLNTGTSPVVLFNFVPSLATAGQQVLPAFFSSGIGANFGAAFTNMNLAASSIAGPFNNPNPSSEYRVVSATLNIIPTGAMLERGGAGKLGYYSLYDPQTFNSTLPIDNLAISEAWDGTTSMCLHWVPNSDEQFFGTSTSLINRSGFCGYLTQSSSSLNSFRFEWMVGIEYIPTGSYRPLVQKSAPEMTFDTYYYVNKICIDKWAPLMIDTLSGWRERLMVSELDSLGGHQEQNKIHVSSAGFSGQGLGVTAAMADELFVEKEEPLLYRTARAAKGIACEIAKFQGLDICSDNQGEQLANALHAINVGTKGKNLGRNLRHDSVEYITSG